MLRNHAGAAAQLGALHGDGYAPNVLYAPGQRAIKLILGRTLFMGREGARGWTRGPMDGWPRKSWRGVAEVVWDGRGGRPWRRAARPHFGEIEAEMASVLQSSAAWAPARWR